MDLGFVLDRLLSSVFLVQKDFSNLMNEKEKPKHLSKLISFYIFPSNLYMLWFDFHICSLGSHVSFHTFHSQIKIEFFLSPHNIKVVAFHSPPSLSFGGLEGGGMD